MQITKDYIPTQYYPITLPPQEALEAIPLVLAELGVPKNKVFPKLSSLKPVLKKINLFLIPFKKEGYEVIFHLGFTLSLPYNALKWGRLI